jgi:hypothetical protein
MRIAFSGTRKSHLSEPIRARVRQIIDATTTTDVLFVGDCPTGVDALVRLVVYAKRHLVVAHAPWRTFGPRAGPARNAILADLAVFLWAFPECDEKESGSGTWDCVRAFEARGLPFEVFGDWKRLER